MMLRIAFTSSQQDGQALRQMLVGDVAELRYLQEHRCRERVLLFDLGDQGVAAHDL